MSLSNSITACLNLLALLSSIPIIAAGFWLASRPDSACVRLIRWPLLILGLLLLIVSLAGFAGAFFQKPGLLAIHLCLMIILILALLVLLVFSFVVTSSSGEYRVSGRGFEEYRLEGFSGWLQGLVKDPGNWNRIQDCIADSGACRKLGGRPYMSPEQFYADPGVSPIQSGCCKPPTMCGFSYVNPTYWQNPVNQGADPDCFLWSNDQSQLCYACSSCKAGLLGNLRQEWRKVNVIMIVVLVVLIFVYLIACSAFRNAQTEELFRFYKRGFV